jgi:hypothetical protein
MLAPHNAEGHLLSLGSPLDGPLVSDCDGADIGASESVAHRALLAMDWSPKEWFAIRTVLSGVM